MKTETDKRYLVLGIGVTGQSVVRHLHKRGCALETADFVSEIPAHALQQEPLLERYPFHGGGWDAELLCRFDCVVVSPGISIRSAEIRRAAEHGVEITGDVEVFARLCQVPVLAVTGSNGKSTVVSLIGAMLAAAGKKVTVAGNLGLPCLDVLDREVDVHVLELSSFQLETVDSMRALGACVLNISADHLDRYNDIEDYANAKRRIYRNAGHCIYNLDDMRTDPDCAGGQLCESFGFADAAGKPADWIFDREGVIRHTNGFSVNASEMILRGRHNQANAAAAVALASLVTRDSAAMSEALKKFSGLPHRMQLVEKRNGVDWYNDSKGTNVGAAVSAIAGFDNPLILIAGGRGKNADYSALAQAVKAHCKALVLIGEEASAITDSVDNAVPTYIKTNLRQAVEQAAQLAVSGDSVLLSPACSSFDMFDNFEARGRVFESEVSRQCA